MKYQELLESVSGLARQISQLHVPIASQQEPLVEHLIATRSHDTKTIEQTLDRLLDVACHDSGLNLFRRLCRHYWTINPEATASYVVCAWLGNTPTLAHKHYLTVTDDHFAVAAETGDQLGTQTPVGTRGDSQKKTRTVQKAQENASFSEVVGIRENARVAEEGFEPPTRGL